MRQMQLVFFVSTDSRAVINILVINDIIGLRAVNYFNRKLKQPKKLMFQNLFLVAPGLFFALFFKNSTQMALPEKRIYFLSEFIH